MKYLFSIFMIILTIFAIILAIFVLLKIPIAIASITGLIYGIIKLRKAISDEENRIAKKIIKWSVMGISLVLVLAITGYLIQYFNVQDYLMRLRDSA